VSDATRDPARATTRTAAIVPAAGRGERLGVGVPKALRSIAGIPILVHAVQSLIASGRVDLVVVAAPPHQLDEATRLLATIHGDVRVVAGGSNRQQSVARGLAAVPQDVEIVLVHDAARALTPPELVSAVAAAVSAGADAVIPVLPVADTIKAVDSTTTTVTATIDRSTLRAVQTPQGFRRALLAKAHAAAEAADEALSATDDAGLVERLGLPVSVIPGHVEAFKVTTPFDLLLAEAVWAGRAAVARESTNRAEERDV
jgi:2-C-methyl-D-erythritol 4-phosphate cytidylyltransferase